MPRIRTIKPEFFKNEEISELPAMVRLLFIGLWTQADREGKLEDRPKRLKAELFPYENTDVDKGLNQLQDAGFILRYKVNANGNARILSPEQPSNEVGYIKILTFSKHQQPNVKESKSTIPEPAGACSVPYKHGAGTVQAPQEGKGKEEERKENYTRNAGLELEVLKFFGFNEQANYDKFRDLADFCKLLHAKGQLDHFKNQFEHYSALKSQFGFKHSFPNFIGTQEKCYQDGQWNAENWSLRLQEELTKQQKNNSQQTVFTGPQKRRNHQQV